MANIIKKNPFKPGAGRLPPNLAGRGREIAMLDRMLATLNGESVEGKLESSADDPVKIIGPRGVGKTVLLNWTREQAEQRGILVVNCAFLEEGADIDPLQRLLAAMEKGPSKLVKLLREFGFTVPVVGGGLKIKIEGSPGMTYDRLVRRILKKKPLLLLLDEVHHFEARLLGHLLKYNQMILNENYPLGVVMAGTPGLDGHLSETKAGFIDRCREIYINTLSDEATLEALREPFEQTGVEVTPDALEALAAQTDGYPYFIQMVGELAWDKAVFAGRREIDASFVSQLDSEARRSRNSIYSKAYGKMKKAGLLPHARRVMEMIDRNGGEVGVDHVYDLLESTKGVAGDQVTAIYEGLREDGFIWTVDDVTRPGIPSFFSYFKSRGQGGVPPKGGGSELRNWLSGFIPKFAHRRRSGQ